MHTYQVRVNDDIITKFLWLLDYFKKDIEVIEIDNDTYLERVENIPPQKSRQFKNKSNFLQNSQPHATISTKFL